MHHPARKWKLKGREVRQTKMAREEELWDDSALTNAFDQAMSKYKRKHIKGYVESSDGSTEANPKEATVVAPSSSKIGGDSSSKTFKTAEGKVKDLPFTIDNKSLETQIHQNNVEVPNNTLCQDQDQIQLTAQGQEEYDLLCKQYYELEEKRGQIWEKLKQYGHSDYSYPTGTTGPCTLWSETSASQNQDYTSQACYPAAITCCPKMYPCSATSCSLSTCPLGYSGPCAGSSLTTSNERIVEDDDIIKKGMLAAQKALSQLKEDASGCQTEQQNLGEKELNSNGATDLSDVLNAWYSAGLYTGKYLTEKSLARPGNG